jgi:quercetin 2,3-dioxygenase
VGVLRGGDKVNAFAGNKGARFLLVSGRPLHEPIAWGGPIVMNTEDELNQAFLEIRNGTFIRTDK